MTARNFALAGAGQVMLGEAKLAAGMAGRPLAEGIHAIGQKLGNKN